MSLSFCAWARSFVLVTALAIGAPAAVAQSAWTISQVTLPETMGIGDIAYGNGRFVITLSGSSVAWSTDGTTWTPGKLQSGTSSAILFVGGQFYFAKDKTIYRSSDGDTWQEVATIDGAQRLSIMVTDGRALLVGSNYDGGQPMFFRPIA